MARLASVRSDGHPHVVPIVFARSGGWLWSPIDGKPKSGRELLRVRNLRREPRAALLLDHYDDDWRRLWWLRIDVRSHVLRAGAADAGPGAAPPSDAIGPALEALRRKYPQYASTPLATGAFTLLAFAPTATGSWCAGEAALAALRGAAPGPPA